jgi:hypothetical protein
VLQAARETLACDDFDAALATVGEFLSAPSAVGLGSFRATLDDLRAHFQRDSLLHDAALVLAGLHDRELRQLQPSRKAP